MESALWNVQGSRGPAGANYPGELLEDSGVSLLGSAHPAGAWGSAPLPVLPGDPCRHRRAFPSTGEAPWAAGGQHRAALVWFHPGWGFPSLTADQCLIRPEMRIKSCLCGWYWTVCDLAVVIIDTS